MNLLIIDHYFAQDIEALTLAASRHRIRVVEAQMFGRLAQRHFPAVMFASLLGEAYALPEYADARVKHLADVSRLLRDIYCTFPFDAVVVPSDSIPSFRPLAPALREMGVPFVVVQKETSISPYTLIEEARIIGKTIPFSGDLMLACSDNQKQFWLNAGADAEKIVVTGQPRFDFYHHEDRWKRPEQLGVRTEPGMPTVLFLSYHVGAYSPEGVLAPTWWELRNDTEAALIDLARNTPLNLLIKPHPQQADWESERTRLSGIAGYAWGNTVQLLPPGLDVRHLIVNVDTIVGFQTTGLLEAMAAGKHVIYTFWTEPARRHAGALLPFHDMDGALQVATSPDALKQFVLEPAPAIGSDGEQRRRNEAEFQLGPLDGKASTRSIEYLERFVARYQDKEDGRARRARLRTFGRRWRLVVIARSALSLCAWTAAEHTVPLIHGSLRLIRRAPARALMGSIQAYRMRCRVGSSEARDNLRFGVQSLLREPGSRSAVR